ncbi:MAG: amidohydrolase family protein [Spirochaetaceae bacterium]|nr:MAG: amidohydrolase family protein [Spirochaetaceae bacterium]
MKPYFEMNEFDASFYSTFLKSRLPEKIFDVHVHINLPEHVAAIPPARWKSDWALECGHLLPAEDAYACARELFPDCRFRIAGFPWPIKEADMEANNAYLVDKRTEGLLMPFMTVQPQWDPEQVERSLLEGLFVGFKPYPDMVSGVKGADISIYDFFPHEQWRIADRHGKAVMLHLPRAQRMADPDNIRELKGIRQTYPRVSIIIAHFGRSFCPYYLRTGLQLLGPDSEGFYFDTAAVINPETYDLAFSRISPERILFGTDMPILFWHGRRTWTEKEYRNLCRENFSWNTRHEAAEVEAGYTLFLYEQMRGILDAMDRHGFDANQRKAVFWNNAERILISNQKATEEVQGVWK